MLTPPRTAELTVGTRVEMLDQDVCGVVVACPSWSLNTDMVHVVWEGDSYVTVWHADELVAATGGT